MFNFPWLQKPKKQMTTEEAQSYLPGELVARMQIEFSSEFRETYGDDFWLRNGGMALAVGPMQTFLGLAIKNGHLKLGDKHEQV